MSARSAPGGLIEGTARSNETRLFVSVSCELADRAGVLWASSGGGFGAVAEGGSGSVTPIAGWLDRRWLKARDVATGVDLPAAAGAVGVGDSHVVGQAAAHIAGVVDAEELVGLDCDPREFVSKRKAVLVLL